MPGFLLNAGQKTAEQAAARLGDGAYEHARAALAWQLGKAIEADAALASDLRQL